MRRNVSTALKRWSSKTSSVGLDDVSHLCKQCQSLVITQTLLKGIPESLLPDGSLALELKQGYINLPTKKEDSSLSFDRLKESGSSGCEFCKSLLNAIDQSQMTHKSEWHQLLSSSEIVIRFRYCFGPDPGIGTFEAGQWPVMLAALEALVQQKGAKPGDAKIVMAFKIHCKPESKVSKYLRIRRTMVEDETLSHANRVKIKQWIHDCRQNHFACSPIANNRTPARPTRLLYVGDGSRGILPRLVLDRQLRVGTRYAALSYCWGPPLTMRLTTTRDTIDDRFKSIPLSIVPRTFVDTFQVVRTLGLEYVWIDALCIMQNDSEDWQNEAAKMGDIYRGAQLTIVAASAKSTNDGFIARSLTRYGVALPYQSPIHDDIRGKYWLTYSEQGYKEEFQENVENSTWNERGWTFQERQLSRRVLFFGKDRVHFECREHWRSEDYERPVHRSLALYKQMQNTEDWYVLNQSWRRIVEEFSARKFTFMEDRLPALAGLARDIISQSHAGSHEPREYAAGHWREFLAEDLTWLPVASDRDGRAIESANQHWHKFRSPTWSWMTHPHKVVWPRHDEMRWLPRTKSEDPTKPACVFGRVSTLLVGADQFGAVRGGFLDIHGSIAELEMPARKLLAMHWYTIYEDGYYLYGAKVHSQVTSYAPYQSTSTGTDSDPNGDLHGKIVVLQYAFDDDLLVHEDGSSHLMRAQDDKLPFVTELDPGLARRRTNPNTCWLALTSTYYGTNMQWYQGLIMVPVGGKIKPSASVDEDSTGGFESMDRPFRRIGVFRGQRMGWNFSASSQFATRFGFKQCRYRLV